jgi:DNA-binding transcriptional LysR family regulator
MELRQIEAFYWTATIGNFARAAERLETSQATVSARIAALEHRLKVKLFDRSKRSARLTARGREMLGWAERMVRLARDAEAAMADSSAFGGTVRVGVSESIVHTWLPTFIGKLRARYPRLDLELTVDITPNLRDELIARELDLAFLLGPVAEPALHNRPLSVYPLVFVASPTLKLGRGPLTAQRLAEFPILTYPRHTRPTIELDEMIRRKTGRVPRLVCSGALAPNIRLAIEGMGIALLPAVLVQEEVKKKALVLVKTKDLELSPLRFTATYYGLAPAPNTEAVATLAEEVAASFNRNT